MRNYIGQMGGLATVVSESRCPDEVTVNLGKIARQVWIKYPGSRAIRYTRS
jgi:hypothetical protein